MNEEQQWIQLAMGVWAITQAGCYAALGRSPRNGEYNLYLPERTISATTISELQQMLNDYCSQLGIRQKVYSVMDAPERSYTEPLFWEQEASNDDAK